MKINFTRQVLPHIIAVVVFLVVSISFYQPLTLGNKTLAQSDIIQGKGAVSEILEYREQGENILWTNSMFSGMPTYLVALRYSGEQIISQLMEFSGSYLPRPADITFEGMISFYILLLAFSINPYIAIVGAISYGLSSFNIISLEAGHNWKVEAMAYIPLFLAGIHLLFSGKKIWGFTLTSLGLALQIYSKHPQITYYLLLLTIIYGITQLVFAYREGRLRQFFTYVGIAVLAAMVGVGCNLGRLWNIAEYGRYSIRGGTELTINSDDENDSGLKKSYAFQYSLKPMETFTLFVPNFFGGASNSNLGSDSELARELSSRGVNRQEVNRYTSNAPTYWGGKLFTSGPVYVGALVMFLFVLGIFLVERKHKIWMLVGTGFSVLLAWGQFFKAFNYFMFDYFPYYSKFRTVEMTLVIAMTCIPLLAWLGLDKLLKSKKDKALQKKLLYAGATMAGILVLVIVFAGLGSFEGTRDGQFPDWFRSALEADREAMLRNDAIRSLVFVVIGFGILFLYIKEKVNFVLLSAGIALLVIVDLWTVDRRYLNDDNFVRDLKRSYFQTTEADEYIMSNSSPNDRVLNLQGNPFNESKTSYFHHSVGGYHGAKIQRYQDLIDRYFNEEIQNFVSAIQNNNLDYDLLNVVSLTNARYLKLGDSPNAVLTNPKAPGNAWLVSEVRKVNNPDEEISSLETLEIKNEAVIDQSKFNLEQTAYAAEGAVTLTNYHPERMVYEASVQGESFAVFSEVYYPVGWSATIDGEPADILRVNYFLRGLKIPAGNHEIVFTFSPQSYDIGNTVMWISNVLLLIFIIGSIAYTMKGSMSV